MPSTKIIDIRHPEYTAGKTDWTKWRLTFEAGTAFIDEYLIKLDRETATDYARRLAITYCPSFAKSAVIEVRNSIYQRLSEIKRIGGSDTYTMSIKGGGLGVDLKGHSMTSFIGTVILPELLAMSRVGILVDRPQIPEGTLRSDLNKYAPYITYYTVENILSWHYDTLNVLDTVLLKEYVEETDEESGLTSAKKEQYRLIKKDGSLVTTTIYDLGGVEQESFDLELEKFPFFMLEISQSMLVDIANYQIALLNLASADMNYTLRSNVPFYTEQYDVASDFMQRRTAQSAPNEEGTTTGEGEAAEAAKAKNHEIKVGATIGRRYPKGLDRPGYIHPSSEPLNASMQKQEALKAEIRQLTSLAVSNIKPQRMSVDSREFEERGLEAGLSYIGLVLEFGERHIAEIWSAFEGTDKEITIIYPTQYSLKSDDDRRREAADLLKVAETTPSLSYKKECIKQAIDLTIGMRVDDVTKKAMFAEVDSAKAIVIDWKALTVDIENGLVGTELASALRGYPAGEAEVAKKDHLERIKRIAEVQGVADKKPGQRGVKDLEVDKKEEEQE